MVVFENLALNISTALDETCKQNLRCATVLRNYLSKQIWTPSDRSSLLDALAVLFVKPSCTTDIACHFRGLILELLTRAEQNVTSDGKQIHWLRHQRLAVALSKIVPLSTDARRFAVGYLQKHPPFYVTSDETTEPKSKKPKKKKKETGPNRRDLLHAVSVLVQHLRAELIQAWDWTEFVQFVKEQDLDARWFACLSLKQLLSMSPHDGHAFLCFHFTPEEMRQLSVKWDDSPAVALETASLLQQPPQPQTDPGQVLTHTIHSVVEGDLCPGVVAVCGVLLPVFQPDSFKPDSSKSDDTFNPLVAVESTQRNLRSLALAVASGSPVLLEGPVGCGKTSLVEHLAHVTGRRKTPHLMKVQLGDQTDSKALLGTYRCTEVPGEFVWSPGALTQAVQHGHWVVLEDLDLAPMDVVSLLVPLLQQGCLSVAGHGDSVHAHPDFRLFATHRLLSHAGTWYKAPSAAGSVLERMWTKVNVETLSRSELQQVITERHPQLSTVIDRLLDIYFLLSAGGHDTSSLAVEGMEVDQEVGKFLARDGRLISTRDLMKWASRIAMDFDVAQTSTASVVFQEALDCFCACLAKPEQRLPLAEAIGARLNVTKAQAEFFCEKHKPNIELSASQLKVGRVALDRNVEGLLPRQRGAASHFAFTRLAVSVLERVAVCVVKNEPVLLVGETGTGKTSSVQYLSHQMGYKLRVINMNQQSDSTDLLGGYKPLDLRFVITPFRETFEVLFCKTFSRKQNSKFLGHLQVCFGQKRWADMLRLMEHTQKTAVAKFQQGSEDHASWAGLGQRILQLKSQVKQAQSALAFSFIEGTLVKALRAGEWVLLDEINLASTETLECLSGLLESRSGSVVLMERGDTEPVVRHSNFRLFACMNPATDVGKKDLPMGVRNRFTELFVDELESAAELQVLAAEYLKGLSLSRQQLEGVVKFYLQIRNETVKRLTDGTGHRPHYSLRTLCRALRQASKNVCGNVHRSLYESFCLAFLTELDRTSHPIVEQLICTHVVGKANVKAMLKQPLPEPAGGKYVNFEGFWVPCGKKKPQVSEDYVLTASVRANLRDLARVVSAGRHPVLIQGETSVGKTSLVNWLAGASGNVCVRINNHEHTDLQEYVGCYAADETGRLVFKEGVLVEAMRKGMWIILDELNLAPTDVLEALNRLLDDNRELYIPETQETVKAHKRFQLFATQNPPGQYGGRKVLSRAFRNRFIELHFDEIPSGELETILHERCQIPMSYSKRVVAVMLELQKRRRSSGVFAGKQGFMTLRDLFRWAERYRQAAKETTTKFFDWDQQLADNGYLLMAGRVRSVAEEQVIREVLQKHLKRAVDPQRLFTMSTEVSPTTAPLLQQVTVAPPAGFEHVVWTYSMRRMAVLVGQALKFGEPVLLVGDTGCGKTTIVQLFAALRGHTLHSVNCHMHTEGTDFLGGLRPVRHHMQMEEDLEDQRLFEWSDGPLVLSMKEGSVLLIDEISLADDSVLERLNSVLEPERTLLLAEKGGGDGGQNEIEQVVAMETFRVIGTMNPGGDYGKKELSPALRNRFTEIWCPQSMLRDDLVSIIEHNLKVVVGLGNMADGSTGIGCAIMDFVEWFGNQEMGRKSTVSIRDLLSWVHFINMTTQTAEPECEMEASDLRPAKLEVAVAYMHGACMVFLDALGSGVTSGGGLDPAAARQSCLDFLCHQVETISGQRYTLADLGVMVNCDSTKPGSEAVVQKDLFGIPPFFIPRGPMDTSSMENYALHAPTTSLNAQRVLRALQLHRPILLEGSPGVGKTSLVAAVARAAGHELVRINLSEQTDVSDLFGADLPVEGGRGGEFAWRDGPLLRALKAGHWVVLDELNLASQSVLEGLNACLDHRAEVYVPELGMTFHIQHEKTRLFACQNPLHQGGGRKGLPRSFLNRFTQVYVEALSRSDLLFITQTMFPQLTPEILGNMVDFNQKLHEVTMVECQWGQRGSPWEFNLRDIFRWAQLLLKNQSCDHWDPGEYIGLIYADRMRCAIDKQQVYSLYEDIFEPYTPVYQSSGDLRVTSHVLQVGHSFLPRVGQQNDAGTPARTLKVLHHCLAPLDSLMAVLEMNWMAILLGPASCGKTSLVELLAQLSGHTLDILPMNSAMDTTELLGGFEQADLNRDLAGVAKTTKDLLDAAVSQLITQPETNGALQNAETLLAAWKSYRRLHSRDASRTDMTEVGRIESSLSSLHSLLTDLRDIAKSRGISVNDTWSSAMTEVTHLREQLKGDQSVNQGGRFEWVDSMLVKALREGHWLLIDNVNFCSPSVLDRLNGLLEPNGVLSISERGVIDGQVPTIVPHPDFRLILAMDPRYGEISRAMRNRGVEIAILGEDEDGGYDDHDLFTLIQGLGVTGRIPCEMLLKAHRTLQEEFVGADRVSVLHLLQTASNCHQQMERGCDFLSALRAACHEVYVKGHQDHGFRKKLLAKIDDLLTETTVNFHGSNDNDPQLLMAGLWPDAMPSACDWLSDVSMATVRKTTMLFLHYVNVYVMKQRCVLKTTESSGNAISDLDLEDDLDLHLLASWRIVLEHTSLSVWRLLMPWLSDILEKRLQPLQTPKVVPAKLNDLLIPDLHEVVQRILRAVFDNQVTPSISENLKGLALNSSDLSVLEEQSVDLRWNPWLIRKLKSSLMTSKNQDCTKQLAYLDGLANRLTFIGRFTERCHVYLSGIDGSGVIGPRSEASLLQLSCAYHKGLLEPQSLPHSSVAHVYPFLVKMLDVMATLGQHPQPITDLQLTQMELALLWLERFIQICRAPVPVRSRTAAIPTLALHWNWLKQKSLLVLLSGMSIPHELSVYIEHLQTSLGSDSQSSRVQRHLWSTLKHPQPFSSQTQADLALKLLSLCQKMEIHENSMQQDALVACRANSRECLVQMALRGLSQLQKCSSPEELPEFSSLLTNLQRQLASFELAELPEGPLEEDSDMADPPSVPPYPHPCQVALWPLKDSLTFMALADLVSRSLRGHTDDADLKHELKFLDFAVGHSSMSLEQLLPIKLLSEATEEDVRVSLQREVFSEYIAAYLEFPQQSLFSCNPEGWLRGKPLEQQESQDMSAQVVSRPTAKFESADLLSFMLFTLLGGSSESGKVKAVSMDTLLPSDLNLGQCQEKIAQLQALSKSLWFHGHLIMSQNWDFRTSDTRNFVCCFTQLFTALKPCIHSRNDDYEALCETLRKSQSADLPGACLDEILVICQDGVSVEPLLMDQDFQKIAQSCIECFKKIVRVSKTSVGISASVEETDEAMEVDDDNDDDGSHRELDWLEHWFQLGASWAWLGLLQGSLLAPQGPVDPAEKQAVKLQYAKQQLTETSVELSVRNKWHNLTTGQQLNLIHTAQLHPRLQDLRDDQMTLQQSISEMATQVAYRPDTSQFPKLLQDVQSFMSTSVQRLPSLMTKLHKALLHARKSAQNNMASQAVQEALGLSALVRGFVTRVKKDYPLYKDLHMPFLCGILYIAHGLEQMAYSIQTAQSRVALVPRSLDTQFTGLEGLFRLLAVYPTVSADCANGREWSRQLIAGPTLSVVRHIQEQQSTRLTPEKKHMAVSYVPRLLKAALLSLQQHALLHGDLDLDTLTLLSDLFGQYVASWQSADEERRLHEEEEASLYRYKARSHGDDLTEEERDQADLKRKFPSFEQDFSDLQKLDLLLSDSKDDTPEETEDALDEWSSWQLSEQEMQDLCRVHRTLFISLTRSSWMEPQTPSNVGHDWTAPALLTYGVAGSLSNEYHNITDSTTARWLLGSHLVASQALQNMATSTDQVTQRDGSTKPYDIYRDPYMAEVVQCRPLLEPYRVRITELLVEWPEHPTLKQILEVIDRILTFPVTSPLMKFVAGLEFLLQKTHEWECNAARHVSLSTHQESLTQMIIQWRKLELKCWNSCLEMVTWNQRQRASRWWFHLYRILQSFLNPDVLPPAGGTASDEITTTTPGDVTKALQQFMEGAPLGEFEARLLLLQSFTCQLHHMEASERQGSLLSIMWGSHQFYSQFRDAVCSQIDKQRVPIEKELKGFVKIARWNDINFWSVKSAVEKTHQILHRHTKEWERVLRQPVKPLLTDTKADWSHGQNDEDDDTHDPWSLGASASFFVKPVMENAEDFGAGLKEDSLLKRLPVLSSRMNRHCQEFSKSSPYGRRVTALDQLTGEVIVGVHELQAASPVIQGDDKDKQLKAAKLLHHQKRKALAELFRCLQRAGLSYKKGLMMLATRGNAHNEFHLLPLDVTAALSQLKHQSYDPSTSDAWKGCNEYMFRSIARRAVLQVAAQNPSQEVGVANLERCKGFTEHLMSEARSQRQVLHGAMEQLLALRKRVWSLQLVRGDDSCDQYGPPPQHEARSWMKRLHHLCISIQTGAEQTRVLMDTCPVENDALQTCESPVPEFMLASFSQLTKGESWAAQMDCIKLVLEKTCVVKQNIYAILLRNLDLLTWHDVATLETSYNELESEIIPKLTSLESGFIAQRDQQSSCFNRALTFLKVTTANQVKEFKVWWHAVLEHQRVVMETSGGCDAMDDDKMVRQSEELVTSILLAVQKLVKSVAGPEQDEATGELEVGHLTDLLQNPLQAHLRDLHMDKVNLLLEKLMSLLRSISLTNDLPRHRSCQQAMRLLLRCLPLVEQYMAVAQYLLTLAIGCHRATVKLTSVLLAVFTELMQKGFCLPQEVSDELCGEGATEFENIEGGGLGEGEGSKDVSDQIESEDQLEDARQQGQDAPEPDPDQPDLKEEDNAIEMSEDMEGKMHDLDPAEGEGDSDQEDKPEPELEKQIGDLEGAEADRLDEQMWGSDEEEEKEEEKETKEESGPGAGAESEADLVAKDDNPDESEADKKDKQQPQGKPQEDGEGDEPEINEGMDEREYDENEQDTNYGQDQQKPEEAPEAMDLPEDLNLEDKEGEDEGNQDEENPHDIDAMAEEEEGDSGKDNLEESPEEKTEEDPHEQEEGEKKEDDAEPDSVMEEPDEQRAEQQEEEEEGESPDASEGVQPQEIEGDDEKQSAEDDKAGEETAQAADSAGKTEHDTTMVEPSEGAQDSAAQNENETEEREGLGQATVPEDSGHEGQTGSTVTVGDADKRQRPQTRPGKSNEDRTVGSTDEKVQRRLQTIDASTDNNEQSQDDPPQSDLYEHVKEATSKYDTQTLDAATADQEQPVPSLEEEEAEEGCNEDVEMRPDDPEDANEEEAEKKVSASKLKPQKKKDDLDGDGEGPSNEEDKTMELSGERVLTMDVARGPETSIHTQLEHLHVTPGELDIEKLRQDLEQDMHAWRQYQPGSAEEERAAREAWQQYEALTTTLAQELCEQLRLVLEPTQASKLRGDYRTGKRLNMRKVIPYIASQFRKDKIWLRRTQPSKRNYQVMVAVDDSSSMDDNHSKQLAFESLCVIANALTLLEVGQLGVASFGETVRVLHPFHEQFSNQSGARILQQFTFEQKKTKIAQLLDHMTATMVDSRSHRQGMIGNPETSQLLLVVSDGRGLFLEGMEAVRMAVRRAREANVFLVFVIVDNPESKDSILDIKVPVFKGPGQLPEIQSYMDHFPFPFYLILRDVNSLPQTLSDALRQWFELVTAGDR